MVKIQWLVQLKNSDLSIKDLETRLAALLLLVNTAEQLQ